MNVLWLEQAEAGLQEIVDHLLEVDPNAALRIYQAIAGHTQLLGEYPGIGRPGRVVTTRELVVARAPYLVAYTVDPTIDAVVILRILHGARLWPDEL